jgi:hypothetical protein
VEIIEESDDEPTEELSKKEPATAAATATELVKPEEEEGVELKVEVMGQQ